MAGVVERVRHHDEAGAEDLGHEHARRLAGLVLGVAREAVRDHEAAVELRLGRRRLPRLARVEEGRDRVLVPVDVAGLQPDDERDRHPLGGGRRRDALRRRRALGVVRLERAGAGRIAADAGERCAIGRSALREVQVLKRRRLVALRVLRSRLAGPRLNLRAGEDRAADRVIGDDEARGGAIARPGRELGPPLAQPLDHALETPLAHPLQRPRDVAAPRLQPRPLGLGPTRHRDPHQGVAARHEVRPVGEHLDPRRVRARARRCRGERRDRACRRVPRRACASPSSRSAPRGRESRTGDGRERRSRRSRNAPRRAVSPCRPPRPRPSNRPRSLRRGPRPNAAGARARRGRRIRGRRAARPRPSPSPR